MSRFPIFCDMGRRDYYIVIILCAQLRSALVIFILYIDALRASYESIGTYTYSNDSILYMFSYMYPFFCSHFLIMYISVKINAHSCSLMAKCQVVINHSNRNVGCAASFSILLKTVFVRKRKNLNLKRFTLMLNKLFVT